MINAILSFNKIPFISLLYQLFSIVFLFSLESLLNQGINDTYLAGQAILLIQRLEEGFCGKNR